MDGERRQGLAVGDGLEIPLSEVVVRTSRSSGPGGQHANVTASRVEAIFDARTSAALNEVQRARLLRIGDGRVVAIAQDARSQARNRELALQRLAERIERALAVRKVRRATRPSAAARQRRLDEKRQLSARKQMRRPGPEDRE